jgi:Xaa-Pro aminopeptidase
MSIKSKVELDSIKNAIKKTLEVHQSIQSQSWVGKSELDIAAFADSLLGERAFATLVGSGANATEVHAFPSQRKIEQNDLIIVDMGAKIDGFCADVTRTFSAGGVLSDEQELIYQIVQAAQKHAIDQVRVGLTLKEIHDSVQAFFTEQLLAYGVLKENELAKLTKLFPHKTSHWIGKEVHEKFPYHTPLQEGMVFTVEPGLYFSADLQIKKYSGIGVRIEDMVLVTEEGCKVLTSQQL